MAGFDVVEQPLEVKRRVGYLPEVPPLYPDLTVGAYLDHVAALRGLWGKQRRLARARVVELCGLQRVERRLIGHLSRGYQQRVGLAQALIHDPEVLILDEPTLGLDPRQIVEIRSLIRELAQRRTVILSTHILPEVSATCGRVIIINEGKVVAEDTQEGLSARLRRSERFLVRAVGPAEEVARELAGVPGVQRVHPEDGAWVVESELGRDVRAEVARRVVSRGWGLVELRPLSLSLEDVFVRLVTEETT